MSQRRQRPAGASPVTPKRLPPARKRFGQHFLKDARVLDAIVRALGPLEGRTVVEIGPGRGVLTDRLAAQAARVIAVEVDRDLVAHLRARYAHQSHVEIVEADVLSVSLSRLADGPFVLAGNVPYYITTPIIFHALEAPRPDVAVYLVQKEVADRLAAPPGDKIYGALSVNVQAVAEVELVRRVAPTAFDPPPTVDSAVVRIIPRALAVVGPELEARFRTFVQAAFGLRRKQLLRVVRTVTGFDPETAASIIASCGLETEVRPEMLSAEDFARLVRAVDAQSTPHPAH